MIPMVSANSGRFLGAVFALAIVSHVLCGCTHSPVKEGDSGAVREKILLEIAKRDEIEREHFNQLEDMQKVYENLKKMNERHGEERAEMGDEENGARKGTEREEKNELKYLKEEFKRKIKEVEEAEKARKRREEQNVTQQGQIVTKETGDREIVEEDAMAELRDILKAEKAERAAALRATELSRANAGEQGKVMREERDTRENLIGDSDPLSNPSIRELYTKLRRFAARRLEPINRETINWRCSPFFRATLEEESTEDGRKSYKLENRDSSELGKNVECYCWALAAEWVEALDGVLKFYHNSSANKCHGAQEIFDALARNDDVELRELDVHDLANGPLRNAVLAAKGDALAKFSVGHTTMRLEDLNDLVKSSKNLKALKLGMTKVEDSSVTDAQTSVSFETVEELSWTIDSVFPNMSTLVVEYLASLTRKGFQAQLIVLFPRYNLCENRYWRMRIEYDPQDYCRDWAVLNERGTSPEKENEIMLPLVSALKETSNPARLDISNFCIHSQALADEIIAVIKKENPYVLELDLPNVVDALVNQNPNFIQHIVDSIRINRSIQTMKPYFDHREPLNYRVFGSTHARLVKCIGSNGIYTSMPGKYQLIIGQEELSNLDTELKRQKKVKDSQQIS